MKEKIISKLVNKKVLILGFAKEGISTYKFIKNNLSNVDLTVADIVDKSDSLELKNDSTTKIVYGKTYTANLNEYDIIIKSPGIVLKDVDTSLFIDKITSQVELMLEFNSANVIGVTGTKGKSTTTSLLYDILQINKVDSLLVGNIGNPILDVIDNITSNTILVAELSSHQLEFVKYSPHIGVILNLFEDHLDFNKTIKHYHESKLNIFKYMNESDIAIYCTGSTYLDSYMKDNSYISKILNVSLTGVGSIYKDGNLVKYNNEVIYDTNLNTTLIGKHNLYNIMVSLLISKLLNLDINKTIEAIVNFKVLENRLENIGTINNVTYYSDTISTIPESTIGGIEALKEVDTLIIGGLDRGINYNDFITFLNSSSISNIICMPDTGNKIGKCLVNKFVYYVEELKDAVELAKKVTLPNKICLLSPAAPSYNKYKSYIDKGNAFKEYVKKEEIDY